MAQCNMSLVLAAVVASLLFMQATAQVTQVSQPVDQICLGCICHGMTLCNQTIGCQENTCGAFRITWAYWSDAGKPTINGVDPNSDQAYSTCTNDAVCAGKAVENYMNKFAQDCTGDGRIDCRDYAAIHVLGGYGCSAPLQATFSSRFNQCLNDVAQLNGGL